MYQSETILTPLYRYINHIIENNNNYGKICEELINHRDHINTHFEQSKLGMIQKDSKKDSRRNSTDSSVLYFDVLDHVIHLFDTVKRDWEEGSGYWKSYFDELRSKKCGFCYSCKNCKQIFCSHIAETLFHESYMSGDYISMKMVPEPIRKVMEQEIKATSLYSGSSDRIIHSSLEDCLIVLKGMSSSTPSMLNNTFDTDEFSGGGFYFRWHGYGVVVDPGYQFVHNMSHYGINIRDINAVVVTHDHIDHNNDIRLLDDLNYYGGKNQDGSYHFIHWYCDQLTFDMIELLQKNDGGFKSETNKIHLVKPGENYLLEGSDITMNTFKTEHEQVKIDGKWEYRDRTFGCKFWESGEPLCIAYTSDTRYFDGLAERIGEYDLLIANISGVYEDDFLLEKPKDRHLGYYGCYKLLMEHAMRYKKLPEFCFVSEFSNLVGDIRFEVARHLQSHIRNSCNPEAIVDTFTVIPADIGTRYHINQKKVRCTQCGKYVKNVHVKRPIDIYGRVELLCGECLY